MNGAPIKNGSNWPAVDAALSAIADGKGFSPSLFPAIADRLRNAIEAPDEVSVEKAALLLEDFYRALVTQAPERLREVVRGSGSGADELTLSYELGKVAFAQLLAARVAGTRADARFFSMIEDARYLPYIKLLADEPAHVSALREQTGERLETVSRKLAILREFGIVASRKRGNRVTYLLTPAALQTIKDKGLWAETPLPAVGEGNFEQKNSAAQKARANLREGLPDHMRDHQGFEFGDKARAA